MDAKQVSVMKKALLKTGKTKQIWELSESEVLVESHDSITAGNGLKEDVIEGKGAISNQTTSNIFSILMEAGIKVAFIRKQEDTSFVAHNCEMVPIEWVARRIATGSYLKRHPGVQEGTKFTSLKLETFFKDDANNDPQWSDEQIIAKQFRLNGRLIGKPEIDIMKKTTAAVFEILEKFWTTQNCTLVDMKVEFGVNRAGEILLADVIDNDSWRLWPDGDKQKMKDKQVYRNLQKATQADLQRVKINFQWVADKTENLKSIKSDALVVIVMGSPSDQQYCQTIGEKCQALGLRYVMRISSAHKSVDDVLDIVREYDGSKQKIVYIAVAGRSNGLGLVMAANTVSPVINCPPTTSDLTQDIWSSLRLPSGIGCSTVINPEAAALCAAHIFAVCDIRIWSTMRAKQLNNYLVLKEHDQKICQKN